MVRWDHLYEVSWPGYLWVLDPVKKTPLSDGCCWRLWISSGLWSSVCCCVSPRHLPVFLIEAVPAFLPPNNCGFRSERPSEGEPWTARSHLKRTKETPLFPFITSTAALCHSFHECVFLSACICVKGKLRPRASWFITDKGLLHICGFVLTILSKVVIPTEDCGKGTDFSHRIS